MIPARRSGRLCAVLLSVFAGAALPAATLAAPAGPAAKLDLHPVPLYGADIRSLVFDPANPERAFAGTSAGHVYVSDDGGASFRNAGTEIPFPHWVVGALVYDENRPGRLWAALWGIWGAAGWRSRTTPARPGRSALAAPAARPRSTRWRQSRVFPTACSPVRVPASSSPTTPGSPFVPSVASCRG